MAARCYLIHDETVVVAKRAIGPSADGSYPAAPDNGTEVPLETYQTVGLGWINSAPGTWTPPAQSDPIRPDSFAETFAKLLARVAKLESKPVKAFPIGFVLIAYRNQNPANYLDYGTWEEIGQGRVLVGLDAAQTEFDTLGKTGGVKTHALTVAEMPSHTHVITSQTATTGTATSYEHGTLDTSSTENEATETTGATGGGAAHTNLQPYITVRMWVRTA